MSEYFEKKLYIPRDVEGEPNKEALKQLREVEDYLREKYFTGNRKLIGLSPMGSMFGGYSTESSDIDFFLLYDDDNELAKSTEEVREGFIRMRDKVREEFRKRGKRDISFGAGNISPEGMFEDLLENKTALWNFTKAIANMSRIVTGSEIKQYRQIYKNEFKKLPSAMQKRVIEDAIEQLVEDDAPSARKMIQRTKSIQEPAERDVSGVLEKRYELWEKRLEHLWL